MKSTFPSRQRANDPIASLPTTTAHHPNHKMTTAHRPTFDPVSFHSDRHRKPQLKDPRLAAKKPSAAQPTTNASSQPTHSSNTDDPAKAATQTTNPSETSQLSSSPPNLPTSPRRTAAPPLWRMAMTRAKLRMRFAARSAMRLRERTVKI